MGLSTLAAGVEHYSRGLRGHPAKLLLVGSNPTRISNLVPSSNWVGRKPLKLVMLGLSPAGIIIRGYSSIGRAAVSKTEGWVFKSLCPCHYMEMQAAAYLWLHRFVL